MLHGCVCALTFGGPGTMTLALFLRPPPGWWIWCWCLKWKSPRRSIAEATML